MASRSGMVLGIASEAKMTDEIYLTAREAAAYLKSSPSTLAKRRLFGNGPKFCRVGRASRYRRADLDASYDKDAVDVDVRPP